MAGRSAKAPRNGNWAEYGAALAAQAWLEAGERDGPAGAGARSACGRSTWRDASIRSHVGTSAFGYDCRSAILKPTMEICHSHNLSREPSAAKPYGIRVSLPRGESFARLLGADWERYHWYASAEERDAALEDMAGEHRYSRRGDRPTLRFEAVDAA